MRQYFCLNIFLFILIIENGFSQNKFKTTRVEITSSGIVSTNSNLPFWNRANQYGIVNNNSNLLYTSLSSRLDYDSSSNTLGNTKKFDFGFGFESVFSSTKERTVQLPEYYIKSRYRKIELYVGRRKEQNGLVDSTLSSGSYSFSGNSLPLPKIQIAIPNYIPILKSHLIFVKGGFSHGWFESSRPVTQSLKLHQKHIYIKFGKANWKMNFFGGINHHAQWGGESIFNTKDGKLPQTFKDYVNVIAGKKLSEEDPRLSEFDYTNRVGNHLGTVDLGMEILLPQKKLFFYRQNVFEDGSLFYLTNIVDGLNGVSFSNSSNGNTRFRINKLVLEFLNTTSQGGDIFSSVGDGFNRGMDDYFNNAQIRDGWSYYGKTIGTPFITPRDQNNLSKAEFTNNNRVQVIFIGLQLALKDIGLITVKNAFSRNWGRYVEPFSAVVPQNSVQVSFQKYLKQKDFIHVEVCNDTGGLYNKSWSLKIAYSKPLIWNKPNNKFL